MYDIRHLRARNLAVIAALPFAVGLPFLWAQHLLFRPSGLVFSLLTSPLQSPDVVTDASMGLYCLLLALALFAGDRFLRRFLVSEKAE